MSMDGVLPRNVINVGLEMSVAPPKITDTRQAYDQAKHHCQYNSPRLGCGFGLLFCSAVSEVPWDRGLWPCRVLFYLAGRPCFRSHGTDGDSSLELARLGASYMQFDSTVTTVCPRPCHLAVGVAAESKQLSR